MKIRFFVAFFIYFNGTNSYANSLSKKIADSYLPSFSVEKVKETKILEKKDNTLDLKNLRPPKLSDLVAREIVFNTFLQKSTQSQNLEKSAEDILNKYFWKDLKVFYGSTTMPSFSLLNSIKKTKTLIGEAVLSAILVTPSSNTEILKSRQQILKTFLQNYEKVEKIRTQLEKYALAENSLLSLYSSKDPLYGLDYTKYMEDYYYARAGSASNKSAGFLEFKKRFFRDFWGIGYNFIYPFLNAITGEIFLNFFKKNHPLLEDFSRKTRWLGATPFLGLFYKYKLFQNFYILNKRNPVSFLDTDRGKYELYYSVATEIFYCWMFYKGIKNYQEHSSVLKNLAARMSDIQTFLYTAKAINDQIISDMELEKLYGEKLQSIRKILAKNGDGTEFGNMIKYLLEMPLQKKWRFFANNAGKLLATFTLFVEYKDSILDAMHDLGEIDTYTSIAFLIKESQQYCPEKSFQFAKYIDSSERNTPYLNAQDFWHPMIDVKFAVTNSIKMDDNVKNIILTGPNAAGKSTFITGLSASILLAQTFGIASAKELSLTPFSKISSYIDISDDISDNSSLFKAEVKRAQEHLKKIKSLKQNEFSFTIFDEPFNGTNPIEGAAANYSIILTLAKYSNSLSIVATHYPLVMLLEEKAKNLGFANYKVCISEDKEKLQYSYKVEPGKSNQTIAIRILEEKGFDTEMLKRAKDILKNPQNYSANF